MDQRKKCVMEVRKYLKQLIKTMNKKCVACR